MSESPNLGLRLSGETVSAQNDRPSFTYKLRACLRGEFKGESRVGFWHRELHPIRHQVRMEWARTSKSALSFPLSSWRTQTDWCLSLFSAFILSICILAILSLFWGSLFAVNDNLAALNVWIVDFDDAANPVIGPTVVEAARARQAAPQPHITYAIRPASEFDNDPMQVRLAIYDNRAYSAIVIQPNASTLLREALTSGSASYDPRGACETIYVEARDQTAIGTYIVPELEAFQTEVVPVFAERWVPEALSLTASPPSIPPLALSPAIGFTTINLRRFAPSTATPAVTVGLIYLIIIAFFSYAFFMPTHTHFVQQVSPSPEGEVRHRKLYFHHLVVWKYTSTFCAYFFMSLAYSLVSLAFQIPFSSQPYPPTEPVPVGASANAYGHASFVVYWCVNWLGMLALGLACENVAMVIGQPFTAIWLIFWVISNVCTAFYPLELAPGVYRYGLFFPLYNVVQLTRIILFDTTSQHVGRHVGILVAWWCVNTLLFPFAAWGFRWKACVRPERLRARLAQREEEERNKQNREKEVDVEKDGGR